jgi:copper chaperone CopZ
MEKIVLRVEGMKCGGCESSVKNLLEALEGVVLAAADHAANQVDIDFDAALVSLDELKQAVSDAGYAVAV